MKRWLIILLLLVVAVGARAVTPEVGKERLRQLIKLPTISFRPDWTFDPESGFALGSGEEDNRTAIQNLRSELKYDDTDAEREQQLAELYAATGETTNSRNSWNWAYRYYRKRMEAQPDSGALLAGLGTSLYAIGQETEAESVLRRAVHAAPDDWHCRVALGRFLDNRVRQVIVDRLAPNPRLKTNGHEDRPTGDDAARAQNWLAEADDCFDKAVALASKESEPYFRRAMHRCLKTVVLNQIKFAGGTADPDLDLFDGCFSAANVGDLQEASRLAPRDYRRAAGTALFEIYSVTEKKERLNWQQFGWNSLPGVSQKSVRTALTRLQDLADGESAGSAAGAAEVLGILEGPVLHETDRSIASLRRAVALQPEREQAWEVLVATLAQNRRYDELLDVCEQHVKYQDSARAHLMLAKAHEKLLQWDSCEEESRAAASDDPDNALADLSLAALLLKRSGEDQSNLLEADDWLSRAESVLKRTPADQRNRQQVIDLTLIRGIYFALSDEMDTARKWVQTVIERDQDNQFAREILAAMDY